MGLFFSRRLGTEGGVLQKKKRLCSQSYAQDVTQISDVYLAPLGRVLFFFFFTFCDPARGERNNEGGDNC